MTHEPLYCIRLGDSQEDKKLVGVLLHGFGDSARGISSVAQEMSATISHWIIPQAPVNLEEYLGQEGYAWFPSSKEDILGVFTNSYWSRIRSIDSEDMQNIAKQIIKEIIIPLRNESKKIVLTGFSQGGMMASEILLQCLLQDIEIHTVLIFSSCVLAEARWTEIATQHNTKGRVKAPSIFISHGTQDEVLSIDHGKNIYNFWKQYTEVSFEEFEGGHTIPPSIVEKAHAFIEALE